MAGHQTQLEGQLAAQQQRMQEQHQHLEAAQNQQAQKDQQSAEQINQ